MSDPSRRERQKQERRDQLIATARTLFAEKGMDNTTIKDIAEAAGVAQGLLYHYFRSKDELLWAIIERYNPLREMGELFAGAAEQPARVVLLAAARRICAIIAERQDVLRIVMREALIRDDMLEGIRTLQRAGIGILSGYLDGRVRAGELRPHDTSITARMFAGSIIALLLTGAPLEPAIPNIVETLMRGIQTG